MREFIELQKEQVSIRREEISLDKQQVENTHQYALRNLDAQVADRESARKFGTSGRRDRLMLSGVLMFLLISFVGVAMYLNKDQIALEIIKGVGLLAAGAFGGYSYGSRKPKNTKSEE